QGLFWSLRAAKRGLCWAEGLLPPILFTPRSLQSVKVGLAAGLVVLGCSASASATNTIWPSTAAPAVLGQIVFVALALAEHPNTTRPASASATNTIWPRSYSLR